MSGLRREDAQFWVETTTARERVRVIATILGEPRSTNWISKEASTAWSTASQELQALVEQGQLHCVETDDATLYQPDYTQLLFEELRRLVEENTREELRSELIDTADETEQWQSQYDVKIIRKLDEQGWDRIYVVTDHGFVLLPKGTNMETITTSYEQSELKYRRVAGDTVKGSGLGVLLTPSTQGAEYLETNIRLLVEPRHHYGKQGYSKSRYYHGGILPQECMLSFLRIEK